MKILPLVAIFGALLGLSSVVMGAVGDHFLAGKLSPETAGTFDIALRYHQLYAVLIFVMAIYGSKETPAKTYSMACILFLIGIVIFSGSLYASLWIDLGPLGLGTPVGGMMLMAGWILAGFSFLKKSD